MSSSLLTQTDEHGNQIVPTSSRVKNKNHSFWAKLFSGFGACTTCSIDRDTRRRTKPLLGERHPDDIGKKCLVLDLDETLVHSSFEPLLNADYIIPVEVEGRLHRVYVVKRPGACWLLKHLSKLYEVVVYTASQAVYADALLDRLECDPECFDDNDEDQISSNDVDVDLGVSERKGETSPSKDCEFIAASPPRLFSGGRKRRHKIATRLYRDDCVLYRGGYVKDLSRMGRNLCDIVIVDNSPMSYALQPKNAVPCTSFIDDKSDRELYDIVKVLEKLAKVDNVRRHTEPWQREWRRRVRKKARAKKKGQIKRRRPPRSTNLSLDGGK
eukprot:g5843.t1